MEVIEGIAVSPGIVVGRIFVIDHVYHRIPRREIPEETAAAELERLQEALDASIEELERLRDQTERSLGVEAAKIFGFHLGMLRDASLLEPLRAMIREELVTAEYAVWKTFHDIADRFRQMNDSAFTTKVNDIDDLAARLLRHLIGEHSSRLASLDREAVIVAEDLTPSQTAAFDRSKVVAFATDLGGRTSHTAIFARALGIPAVVGCRTLSDHAVDGRQIIVDGERGLVVLDPTEETLGRYRERISRREALRVSLAEARDLPSETLCGQRIHLLGNIELPDEIGQVLEAGGEGVGLYRTEFLYIAEGVTEPTEAQHYEAYQRCVELLEGRPLVLRTVDLGADKYTQSRAIIPERNPALGLRSIRYSLASMPMFRKQLRAILRASAHGPIRVMFPLITSVEEFRRARWVLRDVMEELAEEEVAFDPQIQVGMMVEVPSAAMLAGSFAREADFLSIGTNDLVQYTLAVDRTNERVADLFRPTHPAVIRLIKQVVRASNRADTPVSCCGESAGELDYALLLIGVGLRTLSLSSTSIPMVKRLVRRVSIEQCERIGRRALSFDSDVEVSGYLRDQTRQIIPEAFDGGSVEA